MFIFRKNIDFQGFLFLFISTVHGSACQVHKHKHEHKRKRKDIDTDIVSGHGHRPGQRQRLLYLIVTFR
jgi:hypothetical protein